ncbi:MAG: hypothetical protein QXX99_04375 [Candidatus Bathyarchaeia archaeon]
MEMDFIPLHEDQFAEESVSIIDKAAGQNIVLRILGALAVYMHCKHNEDAINIYKRIKRLGEDKPIFTDLDLVAYGKQRKHVIHFFERTLYFKPNLIINALFGSNRLIYYHPIGYFKVDIFFDKLEFSHDVRFGEGPGRGRLELDYPTISLADLALEKLQIHQINLKDIIDLMVLFMAHDVGTSKDREFIDGSYIANILADDWGFWYDATRNLNTVKSFAKKFYLEGKLTSEEQNIMMNRIDKLLKIIEEEPKTKNWLKRAKVGTSKPWYREVEEIT